MVLVDFVLLFPVHVFGVTEVACTKIHFARLRLTQWNYNKKKKNEKRNNNNEANASENTCNELTPKGIYDLL